jgi:hypothetical protein
VTVTYLGPLPDGETATADLGVRRYTRQFGLFANGNEGPFVVGSNANLPVIGSLHYDDPSARCRSLQISRASGKDKYNWIATANYDTQVAYEINPLSDPADIQWSGDSFEEAAVVDRFGYACLNSAGDPLQDLFRERSRRVVTIIKNVAAVPDWIITAEDAVNSSQFVIDGFTVPATKAKLSAPQLGRWETRNNVRFRQMTMTIKLNKDGWISQPLDAGYRYRSGNARKLITNDDGTLPTNPVPLDGGGQVLINPTPARAEYLSFDLYPQFDFNTLPLT